MLLTITHTLLSAYHTLCLVCKSLFVLLVALSEAILSLTSLSQSMSEVMHNGAAASHMAPSEHAEGEPCPFLYVLL